MTTRSGYVKMELNLTHMDTTLQEGRKWMFDGVVNNDSNNKIKHVSHFILYLLLFVFL